MAQPPQRNLPSPQSVELISNTKQEGPQKYALSFEHIRDKHSPRRHGTYRLVGNSNDRSLLLGGFGIMHASLLDARRQHYGLLLGGIVHLGRRSTCCPATSAALNAWSTLDQPVSTAAANARTDAARVAVCVSMAVDTDSIFP